MYKLRKITAMNINSFSNQKLRNQALTGSPRSIVLILMAAFAFAWSINAQTRKNDPGNSARNSASSMNPQLQALVEAEGEAGYLYFRDDIKLSAADLFTTYKAAFSLGSDDQMVLKGQETDKLGMVHSFYEHHYKGIPVLSSEYIVQETNGKAVKAKGWLAKNLKISGTPSISEAAALQIALNAIGATKYTWEDPSYEQWLKDQTNDPNASSYPIGELIYVYPFATSDRSQYQLTYRFYVDALEPASNMVVYVNAHNGNVINLASTWKYDNADATANTLYSGNRDIKTTKTDTTHSSGANKFILYDQVRGGGIKTWDGRYSTNGANFRDFVDDHNTWSSNVALVRQAYDAHWGAEMCYDYWWNKFAWNGFDGNGGIIHVVTKYKQANWENAFYSYNAAGLDFMAFGDGNPPNASPLTSVDVVGHEFGHAVVQYAVANGTGLPSYTNEVGAIDEAFADIWGTCVEFYAKPFSSNWLAGEDYTNQAPGYWTSLITPKTGLCGRQPTTYLQDTNRAGLTNTQQGNWKWALGYFDYQRPPAGKAANWDNGGVHHNNTIGTHWFYLLTVGKSGTNDKGDEYTVEGIGLTKATNIAYRAMQYHLGSAPNWASLRAATIEAAKELYATTKNKAVDPCSHIVQQVMNAWYAVGVGDPLLMFKEVDIKKTSCDEDNGEIEVKLKGVQGNATYAWSNSETTAKITGLGIGEYSVTVTDDAHGCTIDTTVEVEEDVDFTMRTGYIPPSECGKSDGEVYCYVSNVTGTPWILWSTGDTTEEVEGLPAGTYTVMVMDTHTTCLKEEEVELEEWGPDVIIAGGGVRTYCEGDPPPGITLSANAFPCAGCTYNWSNGKTGKSITVYSSGTYSVTATTSSGCTADTSTNLEIRARDCDDDNKKDWEIPIIRSSDPNDITGPLGYGPEQFVAADANMEYRIRYENDPDFATAPALKVVVTMPFHNNAQMFSFRLGDFGFGDFVFNVPENTAFYTQRLDVSDSLGVLVDVTAGINVAQQQAFWIFNSIDPVTGLEPLDATLGYLPVNDSITHRGEGFVTFTMNPAPGVVTGDTIAEQANIVFDINEDIPTNTWVNTIDAVAPSSSVDSLAKHADSTTIRIRISGSDDPGGSGIGSFELYYSKDSSEFQLYGEFPADTGIYFSGDAESEYQFFSIATDNVGNSEPMKSLGEATTTLHETPLSIWELDGYITYQNAASTPLEGVRSVVTDTAGVEYAEIANIFGYFSYPELIQGEYSMDFINPYEWGGGNAVDALLIARHFTGLTNLGIVEQGAADVNASGAINATDAQQVATRFVNLIDTFAAGDWYYNAPAILDLVSDTTLNIRSLCVGDVNASYTPGTKALENVPGLLVRGAMLADENIIDIPVFLEQDANLGSISLAILYPQYDMEVVNISMPGEDSRNLFWKIGNGMIRFAWFNPEGKTNASGEPLLFIRVRVNDLKDLHKIGFNIMDDSRISDVEANVIKGAELRIPQLLVNDIRGYKLIGNYPNPFDHTTDIVFEIPEDSKVRLTITNAMGRQITVVSDREYEAGSHSVKFDGSRLASGIYFCTMEVLNTEQSVTMSQQMIISR